MSIPKGADRTAARYGPGRIAARRRSALPARLTWTDLARDLEEPTSGTLADTRARSLYRIARTHGIPTPPRRHAVKPGRCGLRRPGRRYPSHPRAVRAAYEIGTSYLARGKSREAIEALRAFLKRGRSGRERRGPATWPSCR